MRTRKLAPRCCAGCGRTYRHRQLIEGWTQLSLEKGRLVGSKTIRKYCLVCSNPESMKKLLSKQFVHEILPALPARMPAIMRVC